MSYNRWYLKIDIRKYFDSINHEILYEILARKIQGRFIIALCRIIIKKGGCGTHGLPFLGVRIFPNAVRFKRENFNRSFSKLKIREWQFRNGLIEYEQYTSSMQSLIAHLTYFGNNLLKNRLYKGTVS